MRIHGLTPHPIVKRSRSTIATPRTQQIKRAIDHLARLCGANPPRQYFVAGNTIALICATIGDADKYLTQGIPKLNPERLPPIAEEWRLMTLVEFPVGQLQMFGYALPIGRKTEDWHGHPVYPRPILKGEAGDEISREITLLLQEARIDGEVPVTLTGTTLCVTAPCRFDAQYLLATAGTFKAVALRDWRVQTFVMRDGEAISCGIPIEVGHPCRHWWDLLA